MAGYIYAAGGPGLRPLPKRKKQKSHRNPFLRHRGAHALTGSVASLHGKRKLSLKGAIVHRSGKGYEVLSPSASGLFPTYARTPREALKIAATSHARPPGSVHVRAHTRNGRQISGYTRSR